MPSSRPVNDVRDRPSAAAARKLRVHFSSQTDEWATPSDLFSELDRECRFTLDVCALANNAKCERHFTPEVNGLAQRWSGVCYMNPPYGKQIGRWVKKAYESALPVRCGCVPAAQDDRHAVEAGVLPRSTSRAGAGASPVSASSVVVPTFQWPRFRLLASAHAGCSSGATP